jgi:hypothetical protein
VQDNLRFDEPPDYDMSMVTLYFSRSQTLLTLLRNMRDTLQIRIGDLQMRWFLYRHTYVWFTTVLLLAAI